MMILAKGRGCLTNGTRAISRARNRTHPSKKRQELENPTPLTRSYFFEKETGRDVTLLVERKKKGFSLLL